MKSNLTLYLVLFQSLFFTALKAQQEVGVPGVKVYNFTTFLSEPVQKISADLL